MRFWNSWRLPLRLARRDAMRSRGRSILVLVMIALPVLAVSAAAVAFETQDLDSVESLDRRLGAAEAKVTVQRGISRVVQGPDPDQASMTDGQGASGPLRVEEVSAALGDRRLVPLRNGGVEVTTDRGEVFVEVTEVDLRDPLAAGLFDLESGRFPQAADEVVVNPALAAKGYAVGDLLETPGDRRPDPEIVGIAESATIRGYPAAAGPVGSTGVPSYGSMSWLVDGGPVTWAQVLDLNAQGATVLSRAVVLDPPPIPPEAQQYLDQAAGDVIAVIVLVIVMALIEVVLLAGPAFAVGARRQSRSLALMSATGGTPAQSRRVVLAGAMVLGIVAATLGVLLGVLAAVGLEPVLQSYSDTWFGPFDIPWLYLLAIAGFGMLSAFLAAVVPAWIASRQDVVAALGGRRGDRKPSVRSPLLGLGLLGGGTALAAYGALGTGSSEILIAVSAVVSVLGMILLVPVVVVAVAKLAGRLPLALRFAARDAARHRSRTVPAVAAVAATVAGVVALGIATSSDEAQNREGYTPTLAGGVGIVQAYGRDRDWPNLRAALERELPDASVAEVLGVEVPSGGFLQVDLTLADGTRLLDSYGSSLGSELLVSDSELPPGLLGVTDEDRAAAEQTLSDGGLVAFTNLGVEGDSVRLRVAPRDQQGKPVGEPRRLTTEALILDNASMTGPVAILSPDVAAGVGVEPTVVGLAVIGTISQDQEANVTEVLAGISADASFYVERGYQASDEAVIIQLILGGLGAVLMLGGTLTATFLALSDARPDLATLSAVGASPRTRRGVAAAYAVVVGWVGALLGAVVGFIPGLAISYPLTSSTYLPETADAASHYLDIPWLLILGVVVLLPLLTAAVVGLTARSRLPLSARLD